MYLVVYGEIFLKGANRNYFESRLINDIKEAVPEAKITKLRNRILVDTENADVLKRIFGIVFMVKVKEVKFEELSKETLKLIKNEKTFRITTKRSDKSVNILSQKLNEDLGGYILNNKDIKVKLNNPEIEIVIEIVNKKYLIYKNEEKIKGLGGLPVGSSGRVLVKVNDEKRSSVAAFLMMKRGCTISLTKDLELLHKLEYGFKIKIKEEKNDVLVLDNGIRNMPGKNNLILTPLIGLDDKEIDRIYQKLHAL